MKRFALLALTGAALLLPASTASAQFNPFPTDPPRDAEARFDPLSNITADQAAMITSDLELLQTQTEQMIQYLTAFRDEILAGESDFYNNAFGNFYVNDVVQNPFAGGPFGPVRDAVRVQPTPFIGQIDENVPTMVVQLQGNAMWMGEINVGDVVYIGNDNMGSLHIVTDLELGEVDPESFPFGTESTGIFIDEDNNNNNNNNNNGGSATFGPGITGEDPDADVEVEFPDFESFSITGPTDPDLLPRNVPVSVVVDFLEEPDPTHLDNVLQIFQDLRTVLESPTEFHVDPNSQNFMEEFNAIYGDGTTPVNVIDQNALGLANALNGTILDGMTLDNLVMQFGFSNSDSIAAEAQRLIDPLNPLTWPLDNAEELDRLGNPLENSNAFIDYLTATASDEFDLGELDFINNVLLGNGYFDQQQVHSLGPDATRFDSTATNNVAPTQLNGMQQIGAALLSLVGGIDFGLADLFAFAGQPNGNAALQFPQMFDAENLAAALAVTEGVGGFTVGGGGFIPDDGKELQALPADGSIVQQIGVFVPAVPQN